MLDPTVFAEAFATWTESVRAALPPGSQQRQAAFDTDYLAHLLKI